jgi:hypothetical protein
MLFRETVAVYCENHTEHMNTICGGKLEFNVKACGLYSNQWSLNGKRSDSALRHEEQIKQHLCERRRVRNLVTFSVTKMFFFSYLLKSITLKFIYLQTLTKAC